MGINYPVRTTLTVFASQDEVVNDVPLTVYGSIEFPDTIIPVIIEQVIVMYDNQVII